MSTLVAQALRSGCEAAPFSDATVAAAWECLSASPGVRHGRVIPVIRWTICSGGERVGPVRGPPGSAACGTWRDRRVTGLGQGVVGVCVL